MEVGVGIPVVVVLGCEISAEFWRSELEPRGSRVRAVRDAAELLDGQGGCDVVIVDAESYESADSWLQLIRVAADRCPRAAVLAVAGSERNRESAMARGAVGFFNRSHSSMRPNVVTTIELMGAPALSQ